MKKFFAYIVFLISLLLSAGVIISYMSARFEPVEGSYIPFAGFFFPYFWIAALFFVALLFIFHRSCSIILPLLSIIFTWNAFRSVCNFGFGAHVDNDNTPIKILTYNVRYFNVGNNLDNVTIEDFSDFIESQQADIVCLQEVPMSAILHKSNVDSLQQIFPSYKYIISDESIKKIHAYARGQVILSHFPITPVNNLDFSKSTNTSVLVVDANINGDSLRIANCHLQSIRLSDKQIDAVNDIQHADINDDTKDNIKSIYHQMADAFVERAIQANEIHQFIANSDINVVACGDFNDTPISYTYRTIANGLRDAFIESGIGIGDTYNGKLPPLRIDYILHSESLLSNEYHTFDDVVFSDHFPVQCAIFLNK